MVTEFKLDRNTTDDFIKCDYCSRDIAPTVPYYNIAGSPQCYECIMKHKRELINDYGDKLHSLVRSLIREPLFLLAD